PFLDNTILPYIILKIYSRNLIYSILDKLVHGAGLIEIAHAYYDFFAERKASEENMIKMAEKEPQ
ncbi:hypothetical protein CDL21_10645, partial [Mediterraneibacter gnavus]